MRPSTWMRPGGLFGLALAVLLTGPACRRREPRPEPLALTPCRLPGIATPLECGEIEVWEDRVAKAGRRLKLKVAVARALAPDPQPDPVFLLAGGPGQGAKEIAPRVLPMLERVRRTRDLVFLDQRGTGESHRLDCFEQDEDAGLEEALALEMPAGAAEACLAGYDADVRLYTTPIAMDDLDEVRQVLGYGRINLYGVSYGTRAALVYLRQHGEHVRTVTLDGVAPLDLYLPLSMAADAEVALAAVLERCARDEPCEKAFPRLAARLGESLARLEQSPLEAEVVHPRTGVRSRVRVGRELVTSVIRMALYSPDLSGMVPLLLERAAGGDFNPLLALMDAMGDAKMALGMMYSVVCTEDAPFITPEALEAQTRGTTVGPGLAERMLGVCRVWPRGALPEGYRDPVRSDVPVLLLSGAMDPVTPPRWAERAREGLSRSRHVVVPGAGHNTLVQACARQMLREFITGGAVEAITSDCTKSPGPPGFVLDFAGPTP